MTVPLRMAERYRTLLEVNKAAITQPVPEGVFRGMCEAVKRVMPYDRAGLTLYEPGEDAFKLVARHGSFPDSFFRIGVMLDRKESHDGWALEHQSTIIRRDLETERQFPIELSYRKNQYSEKHAQFLQELSNQIVLAIKTFMPYCPSHPQTKLICPKCIASSGGQTTTTKYREKLSGWGRKGGRGKKNPAGGLTNVTLE